ncbi:ribosomal protein S18-alanine N-acetyltransferase [Actinotalea ferrariae]|uniref:ribosomal protein S18-alanine N-acetyltransferase n=1 Tax=Actinotalea ferrariae TaxID=1386098 RepID=UPI001C8BA2BF|nr:ribosomal protein S18-alanine N-acetyltransferase [Actinotalea ferrariae]MBX9246999.1 ribosomal protein S18-alanine N-acetyltransferase [Actinotalea ferrariae]
MTADTGPGARDDRTGSVVPGRSGGSGRSVRALADADVPRLVELERELFGAGAWSAAMLRDELAAPGRWYVGVDGDVEGEGAGDDGADAGARADVGGSGSELVAYAGLWFDGDTATVMTLGVARRAQRRGLGGVLLEALVARARELGADALLLEVRVDNDPAIALYRRAGFEVLGRRRRYYQPEDVDAFTMRLVLGPSAATYPGHHG